MYCDRRSLFVCLFVRDARCDFFSRSTSPMSIKFSTDVKVNERSRSVFKVICFENDPLDRHGDDKIKHWLSVNIRALA